LEGKAVAVLSNNDGCCISRSNEFKQLGIAMGTPYFQLKERIARDGLHLLSSNYALYGDMSRRIISVLQEFVPSVEQYSIDEAFIHPQLPDDADFLSMGIGIRQTILKWIGIPCGVGFAPTKTLAKIANHIAKKSAVCVFLMPDDPTEILGALPCDEVWGVGRRLAPKLRGERILTARHLRDAHDDTLRSIGGVTLLRTAMELRGISCLEERNYDAGPDSISCSRSFGEPATTREALAESLASFTAQAAVKLRRYALLAAGCNIYAQIFAEGGGGDCVGRTIVFPAPTDATNIMLRSISDEIKHLYLPGVRYRKTGIVYFGLERQGTAHQIDLFEETPVAERSRLYAAVDALNARYGKGKVFSAAQGIGEKSWHMKRQKLSPRPTTRWDELMVVR
jgi:DNA polymerase V